MGVEQCANKPRLLYREGKKKKRRKRVGQAKRVDRWHEPQTTQVSSMQ